MNAVRVHILFSSKPSTAQRRIFSEKFSSLGSAVLEELGNELKNRHTYPGPLTSIFNLGKIRYLGQPTTGAFCLAFLDFSPLHAYDVPISVKILDGKLVG